MGLTFEPSHALRGAAGHAQKGSTTHRQRFAHAAVALALLLMPATYALKDAFGLSQAIPHWVDPTLILALLIFPLARPRTAPTPSWLLLIYPWLSAAVGYSLLQPRLAYTALREPIRLTLCIIWFWVCRQCIEENETLVLRWVALSAILELLAGTILQAAALGWGQRLLPPTLVAYERLYLFRQSIWYNGHIIPRMGGTFIESPPFGLFMFCALAILLHARLTGRARTRLTSIGTIAAFLGVLASLADQVLVALVLLATGLGTVALRRRRAPIAVLILAAVASILLIPIGFRIARKAAMLGEPAEMVLGQSMSERAFHARYSLHILRANPVAAFLGVGPGRYGEYAAQTGIFPDTVVPQVTPVAWLVGYGTVGLALFCALLLSVLAPRHRQERAVRAWALAALVVANGFQANWKWEAWFLALAYLWVAARRPPNSERCQRAALL